MSNKTSTQARGQSDDVKIISNKLNKIFENNSLPKLLKKNLMNIGNKDSEPVNISYKKSVKNSNPYSLDGGITKIFDGATLNPTSLKETSKKQAEKMMVSELELDHSELAKLSPRKQRKAKKKHEQKVAKIIKDMEKQQKIADKERIKQGKKESKLLKKQEKKSAKKITDDNPDIKEDGSSTVKKTKRSRKILIYFIIILILLAVAFVAYFKIALPYLNRVEAKENIIIELGDNIPSTPQYYLTKFPEEVKLNVSSISSSTAGTYSAYISTKYVSNQKISVTVADTTAPKATLKYDTFQMHVGDVIIPKDLLKNISDNDNIENLKIYFEEDLNYQELGKYTASIILEDESGNKSVIEQPIEVISRWTTVQNVENKN